MGMWPFNSLISKMYYKKEKNVSDNDIIDIDEEFGVTDYSVLEYEEQYTFLSNEIVYRIISIIYTICPCLLNESKYKN